jgi:hypothetical protein
MKKTSAWLAKFFTTFALLIFCSSCATAPQLEEKKGKEILFQEGRVRFEAEAEIAFSFQPQEYFYYIVQLTDLDKNTAHYLSESVRYTISCRSIKELEGNNIVVKYEKNFSQEGCLLCIDGASKKEKANKVNYFFTPSHRLIDISSFDKGLFEGDFLSDMGRKYECLLKMKMGDNDYFEGAIVVRRGHH